MSTISQLIAEMAEYERNTPHRVHHFLKVHDFAKTIGELENLPSGLQFTLETAAVVHDIGIRPSLEKYGSSAGKYQQKEGPDVARTLLERLAFDATVIDRVCFLVAHHHTYTGMDGWDYRILVEADFLVNMFEEEMSPESIRHVYEKIFTTAAGRAFCRSLYADAVTEAG
ncbi:MAG: HD domain-containing protein [Planctomycetaceae bacterium]|jgi:HD superfamily phosphodiesterase|nr:HD domain-containing protein [Planctomycetaceae bacterium]